MSSDMTREELEKYVKYLQEKVTNLEKENNALRGTAEERIDYAIIGEDDYTGAAITALQKDSQVVRRRTAIISRGAGDSYGMAEAALTRGMPWTSSLYDFFITSADWKGAEEGKALSEMNATISGKYSKRYPSERVYEYPQDQEGGAL